MTACSNRAGPDPGSGKAVVQAFKFKGRTYELRLNSCGKSNCKTCQGTNPEHGPYWYLCIPWGGKWRRMYIGKDLDTTKFCDSTGAIDPIFMQSAQKRPCTGTGTLPADDSDPDSGPPHSPSQSDLFENNDGAFKEGTQPPTAAE